jgi:hypothetical protein
MKVAVMGIWTAVEYDLHAPISMGCEFQRRARGQPHLSPSAYATNAVEFAIAMKAIDPSINVEGRLGGLPILLTTISNCGVAINERHFRWRSVNDGPRQ